MGASIKLFVRNHSMMNVFATGFTGMERRSKQRGNLKSFEKFGFGLEEMNEQKSLPT